MKAYILLGLFLALGMAMAAPSLDVSYEVTPSSVNPGGTAQVIVSVQNLDALVDVDDLEMQMTSRSGLIITSSRANVGSVPALSVSSASFVLKAPESAKPGTYVAEIRGTYEYSSSQSSSFAITVPIVVSYRSGLEIYTPDTQITPGASENLQITLNNAGKSAIRDIIVAISSSTTNVYPVGNLRSSIPVLQSGENTEVAFQIRASDSAIPGIQTAVITVTYTDTAGSTQTDTQSIGIVIVDAGTEVVVDGIESDLEPGQTGVVKITVKNVGETNLENLYFSITPGDGLTISGSNEKLLSALAIGQTGSAEFEFSVSQDAEAKPVESTLSITYQREGGKKEITDTKPIGIAISGEVDLRVIDKTLKATDGEIEVDIANYGNMDADAVRVEINAGGQIVGTGFTDQIKANKHKVFRFDVPSSSEVIVTMAYKDYDSPDGVKTIQETITLSKSEIAGGGDGMVPTVVVLVVVVLVALWYLRRKKNSQMKIDVSKYKQA